MADEQFIVDHRDMRLSELLRMGRAQMPDPSLRAEVDDMLAAERVNVSFNEVDGFFAIYVMPIDRGDAP